MKMSKADWEMSEEERLLQRIDELLRYRITKVHIKAAKRNDEELAMWRSFAERDLSVYLRMENLLKRMLSESEDGCVCSTNKRKVSK